jgi:hypothetical protein
MIDIPFIQANSLNSGLKQLCINDPALVNSYITRVENKINLVVCEWIFWNPVQYPDEMKYFCLYIVEQVFIKQTTWWYSEAQDDINNWIVSKKIDDFAVTYDTNKKNNTFFWFALPKEYDDIIKKYRCDDLQMWFFDILDFQQL